MKIENSQSIPYSPLKLCQSFPNSSLSDFGHYRFDIAYCIFPVANQMSRWFWHWIIILRPKEQYLYSDHLTELYLSWMRCRHCTATTRQQRISFCIFTIRTILLLTPVSRKGVLYFFLFRVKLVVWGYVFQFHDCTFFNFLITGRLKWHKPSTHFAKIVSLDISFSRYPICFILLNFYTHGSEVTFLNQMLTDSQTVLCH